MNKEIMGDVKTNIPTIIKGIVLGVVITLAFMLIFAALILIFNFDRSMALPLSTTSMAIGCFSSAFYTARSMGNKGYLIGFIIGLIVFFLVTIISLLVTKDGFSYNTLFHFIIILLASVSGGIFGVNKKKKIKYL